jgi:hypothetical protein
LEVHLDGVEKGMDLTSALETKHIDFEDLPEDLNAIGVMGEDGDTKHLWDPKKPKEIAEAKQLYATLTKAGYRAFHMVKSGKGEQMKDFDPKAKRMLFVPPFQGG